LRLLSSHLVRESVRLRWLTTARRPLLVPATDQVPVSSNTGWSDEETDDPLVVDARNFYKVEKWTRDGMRVVDLLYAGSSVDRAHAIFATMHGQALAEHPTYHPTSDARVSGVAPAR
jgi:hypothetical protein